MSEQVYTVNQAMKALEVSRDTIYRWMNSGDLEFIVIGARRKISQSAIDNFIAKRTNAERKKIAQKNGTPGLVTLPMFG